MNDLSAYAVVAFALSATALGCGAFRGILWVIETMRIRWWRRRKRVRVHRGRRR